MPVVGMLSAICEKNVSGSLAGLMVAARMDLRTQAENEKSSRGEH